MEMGEIKLEDSEVLKMPRGAFGPSHMYVSQMTLDIVLACKETQLTMQFRVKFLMTAEYEMTYAAGG